MRDIRSLLYLSIILACTGTLFGESQWPSFRGPNGSGSIDGLDLPIEWDAGEGKNLLWKIAIPGMGHSSPIVWGKRVFLTTAVSGNLDTELRSGAQADTLRSSEDASVHEWKVLCLDLDSGRILWQRTAHQGVPKTPRHLGGTHANPTPATNGQYLIAFFGSEGLYCYDLGGHLVWKKDLGLLEGGWSPVPDAKWGFGSSPLIFRNLAIVQCDVQGNSFAAAYDLRTGEEVWRVNRDEDTSWASPTIANPTGHAELITLGTNFVRSNDPISGREFWRFSSGIDVKIPSPITAPGLVLFGGGSTHTANPYFYALRTGGRGEISEEQKSGDESYVAWKNRARPHVSTPVAYGDHLFVTRDNGVLTQYLLETGRRSQRIRVSRGGTFVSSPVVSDGHLYWAGEDGDVYVVRVGDQRPEVLSVNPVGETLIASPALAEGRILIRGLHHLFAFGAKPLQ